MERYRRVGLTALTSLSAKGITALTMLVSVPLTVDYLGVERYGMWMAISSLITVLSFADLGIGNGLVNSLAEANGKDDREASIRYVSNAFIMLLGIAVLIVAVFLSIYPFVPWAVVFKVQSDLAVRELGPSILLLLFQGGIEPLLFSRQRGVKLALLRRQAIHFDLSGGDVSRLLQIQRPPF